MPVLYAVCGLPFAVKTTLTDEPVCQPSCQRIDIHSINTARKVGRAGAAITPAQWAVSFGQSFR